MTSDSCDFDLFVIGAGSGGVRAARRAAELGVRVAVAEDRYLGGTCVNAGCVPKKLLVYASHYRELFQAAAGFGWHPGAVKFNWAELLANKDREIQRLNDIYRRLLDNAGVTLFEGRASIAGPGLVRVAGVEYRARRILIATGGWPHVPDIPGREHVITSNEAFHLEALPERLLIVGGGYIAVEFAGIFHGLGVETTLCHRGGQLLRGFDQELCQHLAGELVAKGVDVHFNTGITAVARDAAGSLTVHSSTGRHWTVDQVMYATGRRPRTDGLGLENTALASEADGSLAVDEHFQTAQPGIYAIGDVLNRAALTPVALAEAEVLIDHLYGTGARRVDYRLVPSAVFSQPPLATVGLSEEQARASHTAVQVYRSRFRPLQHSLTTLPERTLIKLVVDGDSDRVLGCHMVGPDAPEIIQGLAVAMSAGATKADFDRTLGIHPTQAEEFVTLRQPNPG